MFLLVDAGMILFVSSGIEALALDRKVESVVGRVE